MVVWTAALLPELVFKDVFPFVVSAEALELLAAFALTPVEGGVEVDGGEVEGGGEVVEGDGGPLVLTFTEASLDDDAPALTLLPLPLVGGDGLDDGEVEEDGVDEGGVEDGVDGDVESVQGGVPLLLTFTEASLDDDAPALTLPLLPLVGGDGAVDGEEKGDGVDEGDVEGDEEDGDDESVQGGVPLVPTLTEASPDDDAPALTPLPLPLGGDDGEVEGEVEGVDDGVEGDGVDDGEVEGDVVDGDGELVHGGVPLPPFVLSTVTDVSLDEEELAPTPLPPPGAEGLLLVTEV